MKNRSVWCHSHSHVKSTWSCKACYYKKQGLSIKGLLVMQDLFWLTTWSKLTDLDLKGQVHSRSSMHLKAYCVFSSYKLREAVKCLIMIIIIFFTGHHRITKKCLDYKFILLLLSDKYFPKVFSTLDDFTVTLFRTNQNPTILINEYFDLQWGLFQLSMQL